MNEAPLIPQPVQVDADGVTLPGDLSLPARAQGIVLFAHGSGSSRHSSRNRHVAEVLNQGGLGTLLFDLLTADEEQIDQVTRGLRFDIPLLARRVEGALRWTRDHVALRELRIGLFGASTGAAAALIAAAEQPEAVDAIVSRGGRPDLAGSALPLVQAPTLLIVGGLDEPVIEVNRAAKAQMHAETTLTIVPGASHLFEEPGTLEQVAQLARDWFVEHLRAG